MTRPEWRYVCPRCLERHVTLYVAPKYPPVCWNHKGTRGETMILEHELPKETH